MAMSLIDGAGEQQHKGCTREHGEVEAHDEWRSFVCPTMRRRRDKTNA